MDYCSHFAMVSNVAQLMKLNFQITAQHLMFLEAVRLEPVKILTLSQNQWLLEMSPIITWKVLLMVGEEDG